MRRRESLIEGPRGAIKDWEANMVKKRGAKGKAREQQIIQAAVQAIAEIGLADVRMVDIAERAGMSAGHMTYYFENKNAILTEAIRWSEEGFHRELEEHIQAFEDPWARLEQLMDMSSSKGPGDPGWILWFEVWSVAHSAPEVAAMHEELGEWWMTIATEVIAHGIAQGAFANVDPRQAAGLLAAVIDGLSIYLTLSSVDTDEPGDATREYVMHQCRALAHLVLDPNGSAAQHISRPA